MHIEEVKPEDLSVGFLREFMDLPTSIEDGEDYNGYRKFTSDILTLSLLRVINLKFPLQPYQKYYISQ